MAGDIAYLLPAEPLPIRLMNTIWADREGRHDDLATVTGMRRWITRSGFADEPHAGAPQRAEFRRLRDALRRIAAHVTTDDRLAATSATEDLDRAVADLNAAARARTPVLARHGDELRLDWDTEASGTDRILSQLALEAARLFTEERAELRACHGPGCVLYFTKDHPRREWCSAACGNRARAARHYERHHPRRATPDASPTREP